MRSRKLLSFLDELNFLDWGYRFNTAALGYTDSMSVHAGVLLRRSAMRPSFSFLQVPISGVVVEGIVSVIP